MKTILSLATLILLTSACGQSPLLHHLNANEIQSRRSSLESPTAEPSCPISFDKSGLCGQLTWKGEVSDEVENAFSFRIWNKITSRPEGPYSDVEGSFAVQLWMPSMGHGSSPVTVTRTAAGEFEVSRVYFVMPGDWDIRLQIKKNGQITDQAVIQVSL